MVASRLPLAGRGQGPGRRLPAPRVREQRRVAAHLSASAPADPHRRAPTGHTGGPLVGSGRARAGRGPGGRGPARCPSALDLVALVEVKVTSRQPAVATRPTTARSLCGTLVS